MGSDQLLERGLKSEGVGVLGAKVGGDAANGEVHHGEAVGALMPGLTAEDERAAWLHPERLPSPSTRR